MMRYDPPDATAVLVNAADQGGRLVHERGVKALVGTAAPAPPTAQPAGGARPRS